MPVSGEEKGIRVEMRMNEIVQKLNQIEYICNAFIHPNWEDIRIADIPKLAEMP